MQLRVEAGLWHCSERSKGLGFTPADRRDVRIIGTAFRSFLELVGPTFERASVQLLPAGRRRVFPSVFSLIEMVRAYGDWGCNGSCASRRLRDSTSTWMTRRC